MLDRGYRLYASCQCLVSAIRQKSPLVSLYIVERENVHIAHIVRWLRYLDIAKQSAEQWAKPFQAMGIAHEVIQICDNTGYRLIVKLEEGWVATDFLIGS